MKNVDKKYTPPPAQAPLCLHLFPAPPSLSLTEFLHFVVNALAAKRKTICSHLSCWAGSAARDGEGDRQRERAQGKYVCNRVCCCGEGGGSGWQGVVLKYISSK